MTPRYPQEDLPPLRPAPKEIHTILDHTGKLLASTHEVWTWIRPDARLIIDNALKEKETMGTKKIAKKKTAAGKVQKQATKATKRLTVMKTKAKRK